MVLLVDRLHRRLQHAVDAVLDVHRVVPRLDVDVAGAALDGVEDGGVDQLDDRTDVAGDPLDGEDLLAVFVFLEQLELEALRRLVEHALGALALLEDRVDRRARPDRHLDRRRQEHRQLVDIGRLLGSDTTITSDLPSRLEGNEPVAQHQIRGIDRNSS